MTVPDAQWFTALGVGGILAWGMFHVYRKDAEIHRQDMLRLTDQWKGQSDLLVAVVKENTACQQRLADIVDHLSRNLVAGGHAVETGPPNGGRR